MACHLPLLGATQRRAVDQPPVFIQPQFFFALPDWATQLLATLPVPHSRGGLVLQVGYFKAGRLFPPFPADRCPVADHAYVQRRYHLGEVEWARYDMATCFHHGEQILQPFGVLSFEQAEAAVRQQMNPVVIFHCKLRLLPVRSK
jgi:hypothetical protein